MFRYVIAFVLGTLVPFAIYGLLSVAGDTTIGWMHIPAYFGVLVVVGFFISGIAMYCDNATHPWMRHFVVLGVIGSAAMIHVALHGTTPQAMATIAIAVAVWGIWVLMRYRRIRQTNPFTA